MISLDKLGTVDSILCINLVSCASNGASTGARPDRNFPFISPTTLVSCRHAARF